MTCRPSLLVVLVAVLGLTGCGGDAPSDPLPGPFPLPPPFGGTIFIAPDIITSDDPTTFLGLTDAGQGSRTMFDRRVNGWITLDAFLFDASFDDGLTVEVQVNPEFGTRPFGGGNRNLLIHVGQGDLYLAEGILEETFVHEAAHTSLDAYHASAPGWLAAQAADPTFISTYARDFPDREDIAESFVPYLAVRYRADRIPASLRVIIEETMPNRIAYFDGLGLDMHPID
jgi:hypothetical protein